LDFGAVWPEIILAGVGTGLLGVDPFLAAARRRPLAWLALASLVAAGAATLALPTAGHLTLGGMILLDPLTLFFRLLFLAAAALVILFSVDYFEARGRDLAEYLALILFATSGAMLLAASGDIVSLWVSLELLSVSSYVLVAFLRDDPRSHEAGLKYLLNGALASAVLLFGLSLLYGLTGQTALVAVATGLKAAVGSAYAGLVWIALGMVLAGLAFKIAAAPFHLWAPDAYEGAPTPVTGYLMVVAESAGFAAILRLVSVGMTPLAPLWGVWLAALAILTMTVGNVSALRQASIKRMLAYSSVAQVGYILAGIAPATAAGVGSTLFYLLAYLFTTLGAFAVVVALSVRGEGDRIADYAGLGRRAPVLAALLTLFLASYVGIPATAGFMGKLGLIGAAVHGHLVWLAVGIAVNSAISIGYYWGVARTMWLDPVPEPGPRPDSAGGTGLSLALSAAGCLLLGLAPQALFALANWAGAALLRGG
jgi:NADH-quinone oxidoreductase subunit N